jgi:hypothetical protein
MFKNIFFYLFFTVHVQLYEYVGERAKKKKKKKKKNSQKTKELKGLFFSLFTFSLCTIPALFHEKKKMNSYFLEILYLHYNNIRYI